MIILALETTGNTCGAAIAESRDGRMTLKGLAEVHEENVHDEQLASLTESVLASTQYTMADVDLVAVSGGPGSFTGTRIGVSFAKGLTAFGTPSLAVIDTSEALAQASVEVATSAGSSEILVVIPSHRGLYYVDRFKFGNGALKRVDHASAPELRTLDSLGYGNATVCGPGARDLDPQAISGLTRLSARFVALRASVLLAAGELSTVPSEEAVPLYRQEFVGRRS